MNSYTTLAALAFTDVFSAGASHYGECSVCGGGWRSAETRSSTSPPPPPPPSPPKKKKRVGLFFSLTFRPPSPPPTKTQKNQATPGVADCALLAAETHKFESRYLDGLIAPCPDPSSPPRVYLDRSPIHHLDAIRAPLILFQGLEDKVVPPDQAQLMFSRLRERGLPTALVEFPGEQHGFRSRDAVRAALEGELFFYGRALGFEPVLPADVATPEIVNLVSGGVGGPDVEVE